MKNKCFNTVNRAVNLNYIFIYLFIYNNFNVTVRKKSFKIKYYRNILRSINEQKKKFLL